MNCKNKLFLPISILLISSFYTSSSISEELWDVMDEYEEPKGKYAMMDNYRLYFHCQGEGSPTVLFDGGIADSSANWLSIATEISKTTRTCIFDRAGYGMSDAGPSPRLTSTIVEELYGVLLKAEISGPYVLVGHSFGGYTMQYFAGLFPKKVAGMVLVESSHPDQIDRLKELDELPKADRKTLIKVPEYDLSKMTKQQRYWALLNSNRKAIYAQMQELRSFKHSAKEVNELKTFPAEIPLAVLTRGISQLPSVDGKYSLETVWQDMQTELTNLSSNSWQVIVKNSGHSIHLEAPEVVIENIQRVLNNATGHIAGYQEMSME